MIDWFDPAVGWLTAATEGFVGLLSAEQWEAWRSWLTTIGGLIALSVALATYARNVRLKREEAPRLVYATEKRTITYLPGAIFEVELGRNDILHASDSLDVEYAENRKKLRVKVNESTIRTTIIVYNGSKERMSPAYPHVFSLSDNRRIAESPPIESIDPEAQATAEVLFAEPEQGRPEVGVSIVFCDSSGRWWSRHLDGPLRRAKRVRRPSVRGVYWKHNPDIEHPAFKQDEHVHAVGAFELNVVKSPSLWDRVRTRARR